MQHVSLFSLAFNKDPCVTINICKLNFINKTNALYTKK
jgi:hypothetical protein